jgi:transposase, IS5 family
MGRNFLAHRDGDANNPVLAAGYNFRRLMIQWLRLLPRAIWLNFAAAMRPAPA